MHKPAIFHSARVGGYHILEQKVSVSGEGGNQYLYFIKLSEITRNGLVTTWIRNTQFCAKINQFCLHCVIVKKESPAALECDTQNKWKKREFYNNSYCITSFTDEVCHK